jgi:hypothetical protein
MWATGQPPSVSRQWSACGQMVRLVVASLVVGALALPASASAAVTIGTTGGNGMAECPPDFHWVQDSTAVGSPTYTVPAGGGVITSWSHDRGPALPTAQLRLKVFRKTGTNTYLTVGESNFETLTAAGVNTFPARVQVEGGDILGFRITTDSISCRRSGITGDLATASGPVQPDPPVGSSVMLGTVGAYLLNLAATVEPDCDSDGFGDETQDPDTSLCKDRNFSFAKLKRNKKRGTATLTVEVPGPGTLALIGKGLVKQRPGPVSRAPRVLAKAVSAAGKVKLKIKAKGKKKAKLNETGKVKVKAKVTFTPTGGAPNTKSKRIKLVKRP